MKLFPSRLYKHSSTKGFMAPPKAAPDSSPEQPSGHDEFIESLVAFATERG